MKSCKVILEKINMDEYTEVKTMPAKRTRRAVSIDQKKSTENRSTEVKTVPARRTRRAVSVDLKTAAENRMSVKPLRKVAPSNTKNAPLQNENSFLLSPPEPLTTNNGLTKILSMNMHLSHEFSQLKKEMKRTKTEKENTMKNLDEKISEHAKLQEQISTLKETVEKLEKERFTDNLIDLNINQSASGTFYNSTSFHYKI